MRGPLGVLLLTAAATGVLAAQESQPSSPFHAGDWEVQSQVGPNLALGNLAVLKYTAPTRAWYLFGSFDATKPHFGGTGGISPLPTPGYQLNVAVGRRYLRPVSSHALLFLTPTVNATAQHNCDATPICTSGWSTGVRLNVGGEYLLTPFAGIGITAGAGLGFGHFNTLDAGVTTPRTSFLLDFATPVGLVAFLHF